MNPTVIANLQLAYTQISAQIAAVTAGPNMSYSENGVSMSQTEYLSMLIQKQKDLLEGIQYAYGPFTVRA